MLTATTYEDWGSFLIAEEPVDVLQDAVNAWDMVVDCFEEASALIAEYSASCTLQEVMDTMTLFWMCEEEQVLDMVTTLYYQHGGTDDANYIRKSEHAEYEEEPCEPEYD